MTGENSDSEFIKLKVVDQHNNEVHFRVKVNAEFEKVKKNYSERVGLDVGVLRFTFDGRRVEDKHTPQQLEMKDDDVIEVFQLQSGGAHLTEE